MIGRGPDLCDKVRAAFAPSVPGHIGIALSGGGDSVALMHLLRMAMPEDTRLSAATVDHRLREGSGAEAEAAGRAAARLGIPHVVLRWRGWDGQGNLQAEARAARYRLLTDWARQCDIGTIALGHTMDDQAETVLMRLGRAAGVDGLAGMAPRRIENGVVLVRPLLRIARADLRAFLRENNIDWAEDPSNDNTRFDRVRLRGAMETLAELGLTAEALTDVADNLRKTREALDWYTFLAAREMAVADDGSVSFDMRRFRTLPDEIARRLLAKTFRWVSGSYYPPRRTPLKAALLAARSGRRTTLSGCVLHHRDARIHVCREHKAVEGLSAMPEAHWDNVWKLVPGKGGAPAPQGAEVRALGTDGIALCPDWRETGRSRECLAASPALWVGDQLLAAPLAGSENGWVAERITSDEDFYASLLSH